MCETKLTILSILFISILKIGDTATIKTCKIPGGDAGTCIPLNVCEPLYSLHNKKSRSTEEEIFYRQSVGSCGGGGQKIKTCCPPVWQWPKLVIRPIIYPEAPIPTIAAQIDEALLDNSEQNATQAPSIPLTTPNESQIGWDQLPFNGTDYDEVIPWAKDIQCGINYREGGRLYDDLHAEIDQYPWMALLEYEGKNFKCGGSLLSSSHVLTAAHCLYSTPSQVRLSEYNITSEPLDVADATGGGIDYSSVTIVKIQWILRHPDHEYGTSINDIGLIRMKEEVKYGDFIIPICLPTKDYRKTDFTGFTILYAAGWGSDNVYVNSEIKKSLPLPYVPMDQCRDAFMTTLSEEGQLCAGGREGVDTCRGDSGGPLMYISDTTGQYIVVGIVSSGYIICGTEGRPGIYTYVYKYVDWIKRNIEN